MKSFHNLTIGGQDYKLRLTASAIMAIEKKLGKPLFVAIAEEDFQQNMFETIIAILWGAMQPFNANYSYEAVMELLDQYIDDGNTVDDLMHEFSVLFEVSGFFKKGQTA